MERTRKDARGDVYGGAWRLSDADAHTAHGARSVYAGRFALAWCAREGAYHYAPLGATTRIPTHGNARQRHPMRVAQRNARADVRAFVVDDVNAYVRAFRARAGMIDNGGM